MVAQGQITPRLYAAIDTRLADIELTQPKPRFLAVDFLYLSASVSVSVAVSRVWDASVALRLLDLDAVDVGSRCARTSDRRMLGGGETPRCVELDTVELRQLRGARRDPDGYGLKILDFRIAKTVGGEVDELTQAGMIIGTPSYMSPEHLRSDPAHDGRTDIYSFGVVLYAMLSAVLAGAGVAILVKRCGGSSAPVREVAAARRREERRSR